MSYEVTITPGGDLEVQLTTTAFEVEVSQLGTDTSGMDAATYDPQGIAEDAFARANHTGTQAISTVTGLQSALDGKVATAAIADMVGSDTTGITGADAIANIVSLTQAEYDAIGSPDAATLYVITA